MKVFITGATGFIGTHLLKRMSQTDHELKCLIRKASDFNKIESLGATPVLGDVTGKDSLLKGMKGCDWLINLAAVFSFWEPRNQIFEDVNVRGTRNVMECALEAGVSKVVHISSVAVYGRPEDSPFHEESRGGPVRFSRYAQTKYEGNLIAWELYEKRGLPLVMIFPGAVIGPGNPKASGQYFRDLLMQRLPATVFLDSFITLVHVRDVAEAIIRAAEKENNIGEKYFVCGAQMQFREINSIVSEISGIPLPRLNLPDWLVMATSAILTGVANVIKKPPMLGMSLDQMRTMKEGFRADGSKAERELGITYTPIRVALEEEIASFRNQTSSSFT